MREAGVKASATVKKNARSWVVARSTVHKNLRWRMASGRSTNNSNFKYTGVVILGTKVAARKASGLKARATGCASEVEGRTLRGPTSKKSPPLGSVRLGDDGIGFVGVDG